MAVVDLNSGNSAEPVFQHPSAQEEIRLTSVREGQWEKTGLNGLPLPRKRD